MEAALVLSLTGFIILLLCASIDLCHATRASYLTKAFGDVDDGSDKEGIGDSNDDSSGSASGNDDDSSSSPYGRCNLQRPTCHTAAASRPLAASVS